MSKIIEKKLEKIAQEELDIETLSIRNSDYYDFHEVSVWSLKETLMKAYELGKQSK